MYYSFPIESFGRQLPAIGLGTFQPEAASSDIVKQAVVDVLDEGYRRIDTAFMYGNGVVEEVVGDAIRERGGPREDLWVVSKLYVQETTGSLAFIKPLNVYFTVQIPIITHRKLGTRLT